jgi:hypothetical protein
VTSKVSFLFRRIDIVIEPEGWELNPRWSNLNWRFGLCGNLPVN